MFANSYSFSHVTSSPRFPQSNGQVERGVQKIKRMLKKSQDPHLAILSYRATPHPWCGLSPAELCMGRRIRTTVPQTMAMLKPQLVEFKRKNALFKAGQKKQFDRRHQVKELPQSLMTPRFGSLQRTNQSQGEWYPPVTPRDRMWSTPSQVSCGETEARSMLCLNLHRANHQSRVNRQDRVNRIHHSRPLLEGSLLALLREPRLSRQIDWLKGGMWCGLNSGLTCV